MVRRPALGRPPGRGRARRPVGAAGVDGVVHLGADGRSDLAAVVHQLFGGALVEAREVGAIAQQHEPRTPVAEPHADHRQRLARHVGARVRLLGQQLERVAVAEILALEAHRLVTTPGQRRVEHRPAPPDAILVRRQRVAHVRAHAVHVDVQLLLAAAVEGVDGEREVLARHGAADPRVEQGARGPRVLEVVERARRQQFRRLDSGHPIGRDEQQLGVAADVFQHRIAIGEVHPRAGGGIAAHRHVGRAEGMDDAPERVRVPGVGRARRGDPEQECEAGGDHRAGRDIAKGYPLSACHHRTATNRA